MVLLQQKEVKDMKKFLLLLIAIPFIELIFVMLCGKMIGLLPTLLLILFTGILGVYMAKTKGLKAFEQLQKSIKNGQAPGDAIIDGVLTLIGAILLVLPGFVSDILGLLLMLPFVRKMAKPGIYYWLRKKMKSKQTILMQR